MPLIETSFGSALPIDGYGPGFFRVDGIVYPGGIVIRAEGLTGWQGYADRAPLLSLAGAIDVLFIGTGAEIAHLPPDLIAALESRGLMAEPMSTPSAARTYNVLLSEGRRVAAALLPMPGRRETAC
ncbi:Mth938-like domain-containing protein [Phaeovulum sp.]|uniref:Mth938-like domain-containing protein n=1 Tax=Phaeovulum sp. TaxID=2934796 RepID=UPI0039E3459B